MTETNKWPIVERSVEIPAEKHVLLSMEELVKVTRATMVKQMAEKLLASNPFLDNYEPIPLTRRQRFALYRERVRDAWEVLMGRATIGSDW